MALITFLVVIALVVIAFAEPLSQRLGLVAPVILLVIGAAVAYLPQVPEIGIEPDIILQLILPPLLFATAMRMPQHDFRRNFSAIFILAVVLVGATALAVGVVIHALVPEIPVVFAVAVGAVVSPSDAVAVGIVRRAGVSRRIIAILDGEGLINDASALVLLSTALLAAQGSVSAGEVAADFLWAVIGAVAIGYAVGRAFMFLRTLLPHPTSSTVLSLAIPFASYLPAEELGSSGLVATVVAGLVASEASARLLHPATRISDARTWDTVGLILESLVFVLMGLQMPHLVAHAHVTGYTPLFALGVALAAWATVLLVRAATVFPLVAYLGGRALPSSELAGRIESVLSREPETRRTREIRKLSDDAYFSLQALGPRAGGVLVWAGMRGAVTLAAAQTLPHDTPARGFLVLVAFFVAAVSLAGQGASLGWVVDTLRPGKDHPSSPQLRARIREQMRAAALGVEVPQRLRSMLEDAGIKAGDIPRASLIDIDNAVRGLARSDAELLGEMRAYAAARIGAQREALLGARDSGVIDAVDFDRELGALDAQQLAVEALAKESARHRQGGEAR
ncbi:cation:proton antiporter [Corynebacterium liangguodongii]|uniref:Cation:proton antiporter n=1 Tax=Corynebacterium liangguodongii TaxID=2079535 RepID=A0A2S0WCM3_9CORY|nr:sodium:proton antiporter [Corynebacterium liangguodongii]AWB83506.1 cation:proton antiporter [Corynebacterium liangguodongii]PWC00405.1 sodium:proton antiporter [Corynebacterium liangguodongii]